MVGLFFGILVLSVIRQLIRGKMIQENQAKVMSVSEKSNEYTEKLFNELKNSGIRAELDIRNEKIGYKIREAQLKKIPYMLILGENESSTGCVSVRSRDNGDLGSNNLDDFIKDIKAEIESKGK